MIGLAHEADKEYYIMYNAQLINDTAILARFGLCEPKESAVRWHVLFIARY